MAELQTTLRDIAAAIVDHPDEVAVTCEETEDSVTLTLSVAPDDMGMVIGRHGRIAKAIRTVIKAASANCSQGGAARVPCRHGRFTTKNTRLIPGIKDSSNQRFVESKIHGIKDGCFLHSALYGVQRRVSSV